MSSFSSENIDYAEHNEEVKKVMSAFDSGNPYRVPVIINGSITNYIFNRDLNTKGYTFENYFNDPDVQISAQLEYQKWKRFNVLCDMQMGYPAKAWSVYVDFQNSFDAAWFGCPIKYIKSYVPDTVGILENDRESLYDMPETIRFDNALMSRSIEFFEYMHGACKDLSYCGLPVKAPDTITGENTDGIFTLAAKIRGMENILTDMLLDEDYYNDLMSYLTRNIINRIKKLKEYRWEKHPDSKDKGIYRSKIFFADDSISMISLEQYKKYVYPYHKLFFDEFSDGSKNIMHLCGDATRHFKFIKDNLNIGTFDTGFPVDHGQLREDLGRDVIIQGGPTVMMLKDGSFEEIDTEVKRICESGVMEGGKFILIAANNLAPCTPCENISQMYRSAKKYGVYAS